MERQEKKYGSSCGFVVNVFKKFSLALQFTIASCTCRVNSQPEPENLFKVNPKHEPNSKEKIANPNLDPSPPPPTETEMDDN